MALSASTLAALIKSNILALPDVGAFARDDVLLAIAQAVVTHFQTSGTVLVTGVFNGGGTAPGTIT